ncbi:hypothetical protein V7139_23340 [Neobacillus drentensis]
MLFSFALGHVWRGVQYANHLLVQLLSTLHDASIPSCIHAASYVFLPSTYTIAMTFIHKLDEDAISYLEGGNVVISFRYMRKEFTSFPARGLFYK